MRMQISSFGKFFALLLLFVVTSVFAEDIDCIHYSGSPNPLCKYIRLDMSRRFNLYTMDEGVKVEKDSRGLPTNSKHNTDFYVYAPKAENDSLEIFLRTRIAGNPDTTITNLQKVNSLDSGFRWFGISAYYAVYNIAIGTSIDKLSEPALVAVYNFYAPGIQYCFDASCDSVVTSASDLNLDVGDSTKLYARAYITIGPDSGTTDTSIVKTFYFSTEGAGDNLEFHSLSGKKLPEIEHYGIQLDFASENKGVVGFVVVANGVGSAEKGKPFTLSGYPEDFKKNGDAVFYVNEAFPGALTINNRNLPHIDSAVVLDTDGDGVGDQISAWFSGDKESFDLTDFAYSWPTTDKFGKWNSCKDGDGKNCKLETEINFEELNLPHSGNGAKGSLKVAVESQYTGASDTLQAQLVDRIGAVISTASIIYGEEDTDVLIIKFNKDIDTSWNEGKGFILNGKEIKERAIEKNGDEWRFSVDTGVVHIGDMISISLQGGIQAADGNKTRKNREVPVKNAGGIYATDENNGFYDRNSDGTMDSASVGFQNPLTKEDLKTMEVSLFWLDSKGNVKEHKFKSLDSLLDKGVISLSEDKTVIGFDLSSSKYDIKKMLTNIDSTNSLKHDKYGFAEVSTTISIEGHDDSTVTMHLLMHDRMPPVVSGTFLKPESFQKAIPDEFMVEFSEPVDTTDLKLSENDLAFLVDGQWVHYSLSSHHWSNGGKTLNIFLENGIDLGERMNPADSMKFSNFTNSFKDIEGNGVREDAPAVMVHGDPRVIAKETSLATLERAVLLADKAAFTERFVEPNVKMDSEMKKSLGVLLDVGFSTIMKGDSSDANELDLENIGLHWELDVFTNLGGFVAHASSTISCNDKSFNGNCFENPRKLYLRWNMRSDNGRKVGVGAYVAKLKVKVFGAQNLFKVERIYSWGIRAGSDGLKLGE